MTNSDFRGIIEDFIWDIEQFQKDNDKPEAEELCENIVSDLGALDGILRRQEEKEPDYDGA